MIKVKFEKTGQNEELNVYGILCERKGDRRNKKKTLLFKKK